MMENNTKLLSCPFCGGEAHKRIAFPVDSDGLEMNKHIVGCKTCDIEFSCFWDEEYAVELWNTRKPIDDIVAELESRVEFYHNTEDCDCLENPNDAYIKGLTKGYAYAIDIVRNAGKEVQGGKVGE